MKITEKAAYIKGLAQGLKLDKSKPENEILLAIIDILDDISLEMAEIQESHEDLYNQVEDIDEDLNSLEEDFYDDCDTDESFTLTCPKCNESFTISEDCLLKDKISCPNCGEKFGFDLDTVLGHDKCGCGCGDENCICESVEEN
jgi:hypothetical protein